MRPGYRKVTAGSVAGIGATVASWLLGLFGVPIPAEVAAALGSAISLIAVYLRKEVFSNQP